MRGPVFWLLYDECSCHSRGFVGTDVAVERVASGFRRRGEEEGLAFVDAEIDA